MPKAKEKSDSPPSKTETPSPDADACWQENSRDALADALERVEAALTTYAETLNDDEPEAAAKAKSTNHEPNAFDITGDEAIPKNASGAGDSKNAPPSALGTLCDVFNLSEWERDTLVLCAGVELSASFAALCARINGDTRAAYATFGIALAALPGAHWDALRPEAPLRAWHLAHVAGIPSASAWGGDMGGASLTRSPLRADERIIHYIAGVHAPSGGADDTTSERLLAGLLPIRANLPPTESQRLLAEQIISLMGDSPSDATALRYGFQARQLPVPFLSGTDDDGREAVALHVAQSQGLPLHRLDASEVATWGADLDTRTVLLRRECSLHPFALLLELGEGGETGAARVPALRRFVEQYDAPLFLSASGEERLSVARRTLVPFEVPRPTSAEQFALWQAALASSGETEVVNDVMANRLAGQFSLSSAQIQVAALYGEPSDEGDAKKADASEAREKRLWDACRMQARPRLDSLALRIEGKHDWEDLVLPEMQKTLMRDVLAHVRQRQKVHDEWGWAKNSARGLGLSALFAGTSGTGKTLAAEVIAQALNLDLYRVDLSQTISKYIGETEKNLGRIFDAAEVGSVILLFDEADALFGKRSEVQDSHDRYANIEVSYLLQRMEQYRGLAILTTNLKNSLDVAFLRRLRFVVNFPFPDAAQREAIWRRAFPKETPTEGLEWARLAQWSVAGGNIKSAALNAAFLAADENVSLQMRHLLRAAQIECAKLDRPLIEAEVAGWVS